MRGLRWFCLLVILGLVSPAAAVVCQPDVAPAATLLIPYFEVDLQGCDTGEGTTTLFSVLNASPAPHLTQVTLWSTGGVPVVGFWVYLGGYSLQPVNLRDVLCSGVLPITGPGAEPPGELSYPPQVFPNCLSYTSVGPATIDQPFLESVRQLLIGRPSPLIGWCAGIDYGDMVARGYVTIDVVNQCSMEMPIDFGYQANALEADNVLLGDWMLVDTWNNFEQAFTAVHVEADATRFVPGDGTFYGEYTGASAVDVREPLPTSWAARFDGADSAELVVWRGVPGGGVLFPCGFPPQWYPLSAANASGGLGPLIFFDDEGSAAAPVAGAITFPAATQRLGVQGPEIGQPGNRGWAYLNLQHNGTSAFPGGGPAWVGVISSSEGRFSMGVEATALDSSCGSGPLTIDPDGPTAENPGWPVR